MSRSILDEYIRRRSGSAVYNPRQIQYGQGMSYRQPTDPQTQMPANQIRLPKIRAESRLPPNHSY